MDWLGFAGQEAMKKKADTVDVPMRKVGETIRATGSPAAHDSIGPGEPYVPESSRRREIRVAQLGEARFTLKSYLRLKLHEEDWHGVQDAASDLRDIDAELKGLAVG